MTKPVFLITLGAVAGAFIGVVNGGGELGRGIADAVIDRAGQVLKIANVQRAPAPSAAPDDADEPSHFVFSACLSKSGANVEATLRNLLEFHEHKATLALVGCLLDGEPQRFCSPEGRRLAADAMEIYLWSRDDQRHATPAHGLAARIHMLNQSTPANGDSAPVDPYKLTWSGPEDLAVFDRVKGLVRAGWLDASAFAFSGREDMREALRDITPTATPCSPVAEGN